MAMSLPLKTELFLAICNAGKEGIWEIEAIEKMLATESGLNKEYWKNLAAFWLMEMTGNGVIQILEQRDDSEYYGRELTISKYAPTELGMFRKETMI